jgi:hypothetical protein
MSSYAVLGREGRICGMHEGDTYLVGLVDNDYMGVALAPHRSEAVSLENHLRLQVDGG